MGSIIRSEDGDRQSFCQKGENKRFSSCWNTRKPTTDALKLQDVEEQHEAARPVASLAKGSMTEDDFHKDDVVEQIRKAAMRAVVHPKVMKAISEAAERKLVDGVDCNSCIELCQEGVDLHQERKRSVRIAGKASWSTAISPEIRSLGWWWNSIQKNWKTDVLVRL